MIKQLAESFLKDTERYRAETKLSVEDDRNMEGKDVEESVALLGSASNRPEGNVVANAKQDFCLNTSCPSNRRN